MRGIAMEVTERKELGERFRNQSARLQTLLETASDAIHILDMQGNLVQFSDSFATMLGYTHEETAKLNVTDWEAVISKEQQQIKINGLVNQPARFETKHRQGGRLLDRRGNQCQRGGTGRKSLSLCVGTRHHPAQGIGK